MPTADEQNLSDNEGFDDDDFDDSVDGEATKCWCSICGTEIGLAEALRCDACGCMFCGADCARQYRYCDAPLHR
jgi:hypothetical protein